jgi:class 3 adenylate cyclase
MVGLLNQQPDRAGKAEIRIGVGIASGSMIAGYTGTQQRATYTCVGDTVNLAARLEAHTKTAQRTILIDGATQAALGAAHAVEALGSVEVKGKAQPVEIFSLR